MDRDAEPGNARSSLKPAEQVIGQLQRFDRGGEREITGLHDEWFVLVYLDRAHRLADRLWVAGIDKAVAAVLEDHEGGAEPEINRNGAELPRKIGRGGDLDPPLLQRAHDIAV